MENNQLINLFVLTLLFCTISCSNSTTDIVSEESNELTFNSEQWQSKLKMDYPFRNRMIKNIFDTDTLKRLNKAELRDVLGEPNRTDSLYLFYMVAQKRIGLFPLHTKTLVIKLAEDETVEKVMIHE